MRIVIQIQIQIRTQLQIQIQIQIQAKSCPLHTSRLIPGTENNENCYKSLFSCLDYLGQITWNDDDDNNDDDGNDDGDHGDVSIHTSSICCLFIYKESILLTYSKRAILTSDCYPAFSPYLRSLIAILFSLFAHSHSCTWPSSLSHDSIFTSATLPPYFNFPTTTCTIGKPSKEKSHKTADLSRTGGLNPIP